MLKELSGRGDTKMRNYGFFVFILIFSLVGCKSLKITSAGEDDNERPKQIVFHNFLAFNDNGNIVIEEKEKFLRDGKVKDLNPEGLGMLYPVEVGFKNEKNRELKKIYIEHPLINVLEYAGDNDHIKRVTVYRDSAIFTLRYNSIEELKRISFASVNKDTLTIETQLVLKK